MEERLTCGRKSDCPTTNEVFISLLVYFDRMSQIADLSSSSAAPPPTAPPSTSSPSSTSTSANPTAVAEDQQQHHLQQQQQQQGNTFAVDNFNIHRLIISGITVASKFFSDVFYTNSRYAKVSERFRLSGSSFSWRGLFSQRSLPFASGARKEESTAAMSTCLGGRTAELQPMS